MVAKVFISYKTGETDGLTREADMIQEILLNHGFSVWRDKLSMEAGKDWNAQIYEEIRNADVLVLVLAPPTAQSRWVQREIDVAKGALTRILPVLVRGDGAKNAFLEDALRSFDLDKIQVIDFTRDSDTARRQLFTTIEKLADEARRERRRVFGNGAGKPPCTSHIPDADHYVLRGIRPDQCVVVLAKGDMLRMRGIDILVNSENNYMQMARFFEPASLSKKIRLKGAHKNDSGHIIEDTVQFELYRQISRRDKYTLPVGMGRVIPTNAGHPDSELADETDARYIFHVSAVEVDLSDPNEPEPFRVIRPASIRNAVKWCMELVCQINADKGEIFGDPLPQQFRDAYQPLTSIIYPMFGTGHAGKTGQAEMEEIAGAIADGLIEHLPHFVGQPHFTLNRIHLCAYSEDDYRLVRRVLDAKFR